MADTKDHRRGIAHWPQTERPRERLLAKGSDALSDAHLLAILLRTGRRDSSAVQVAIELLDRMGGLGGIAACGIEELCAIPGVGLAKAAQL
jgi:DNA repair protein RadC